ncbi:hypothetical protein M9Y10_001287 [Tritrichomonas musculus]|uniref:TPR Domain containing protein n=1 Tax=Tritrichomonas musculus TaxID=1915356 RepID=A0ABR2L6K8_9EUKA
MFRFWDQSPKYKIEQMLERGEVQKAFTELSNIINETQSFDPIYLEMRARCAMVLSMTAKAIFDLSQLLVFQNLAQIERDRLLSMRASAYLRIGDYENSLRDGKVAFSNKKYLYNFRLLNELINEARLLISQENLTEKSIIRLLSISPESPAVLYKASNFYLNNKNFDEFDKYSQKFLIYDPTNSEILMKRSIYLMCNANNIDESLNILKSCTNDCQDLRNNATYLTKFLNSIQNGNFIQIDSLLNKSSEIINSVCNEGSKLKKFIKFVNMTLLHRQNKLDDAYDIVEEILLDDHNDINAIICKADILFDSRDFESALEVYQQVLSFDIILVNPENYRRINKRITTCQKLIEDQQILPFQVLGIPENSDLNTVHAAYRNQISELQSNDFRSMLSKKIANKRMIRINSSYEKILSQFRNQQQKSE